RIAKENATVADALIAQAEDLVTKANAATDDGQKNALMARAGRQRANARAAYERARAALRTGETLAAEARGSRDRASVADGLQKSLQVALAGTNEDVMVAELTKLRAQLDQKNAPDARLTPAEKLRRQATQREKESAALTARAHDARNEENELIDRIGRIKLEESAARGGKKDELVRKRLELEAQLEALHQENERAVAKAGTAEQESASARGQAALARKLETGNTVADPFPEAERSRLAQQIASTGPRIGAIALDERFDGTSGIAASELERRTFDWGYRSPWMMTVVVGTSLLLMVASTGQAVIRAPPLRTRRPVVQRTPTRPTHRQVQTPAKHPLVSNRMGRSRLRRNRQAVIRAPPLRT
ncbi:MAG TPA: hypothetical protein P5291_11985, partial [Flavobacteriales bacterium]|nr:hypothetical protein [Flavobacteriales bacterium]